MTLVLGGVPKCCSNNAYLAYINQDVSIKQKQRLTKRGTVLYTPLVSRNWPL